MKATLSSIGILGSLLFGALFALTFGIPDSVERAGQAFIKYQVEQEVRDRFESSRLPGFKEKAEALAEKYELDIAQTKQHLEDDLPRKIAAVIGALCRMDCTRKKALEASIKSSYLERIAKLGFASDQLGQFIAGKYLEVVARLTRDMRIFLGSNSAMFLLLLVASLLKPQAVRHLFLPSILLLLATLISSGIYLFGQNWFFTIVYNDYTGFGYLAYLAAIFGILLDIVFNRARVTTEIVNFFLQLFGSAFSLVAC